ncbi:transporter substrate-binding domain-containing protein [Rugamonas sp. FT107W]|uniref:Transporter substrate-binding domain-containing protein n=1 Tax=Duganella vulcania TaxID=2692166 RepID=A0A845HPC3_9BURK|nr:transporter substrate-binding domain-containing protein [Duganella vulcania]MYN20437.1 transporter substrate-binding domain-containing protein [Duganella vulcania]
MLRVLFLWLLLAPACRAQEPVVLYYNERPPYLMSAPDGGVHGLTADPAAAAFADAGVPARWMRMPSNRQLALLQKGGQRCAVGWFRTAERERYARFTLPIYRDLPLVAVVRDDFALRDGATLRQLLAMPGVAVLVKEKYSYGGYVDAALAEARPIRIATTAESMAMVAMIGAHRADLMFLASEEADYLLQLAELRDRGLRVLRLTDVPTGERRHIMCSKDVSDDIMRRLDKEIQQKPGGP